MKKLTCFVVQGFGPKTDYTDGRVLNLDASYDVIKQAVEEAGLNCLRADEIIHSGTIDIPMYEQLLRADLVIADLSTNNVNAAFELGVRYGLRPRSTIVIAEEKFKSPFDVNHIVIRRYKHMGEDIGMREARRFKDELITVIKSILDELRTDSPVYSLFPSLRPPEYVEEMQGNSGSIASPLVEKAISELVDASPMPESATDSKDRSPSSQIPEAENVGSPPLSARQWLDYAQNAMKSGNFDAAKIAWKELLKLKPHDSHATRQLTKATYKASQPPEEETLLEARDILKELLPATTNNPETLGIWGAIHKHLWSINHDDETLDEAIAAYERSFNLKQDYYNDINFAFVLNLRAVERARKNVLLKATADELWARRIWCDVIRYMSPLAESEELDNEKQYWVFATLWECALGLDDEAAVAKWDDKARGLEVPAWMRQTREKRGERLRLVQQELKKLLPPGFDKTADRLESI
jgi:tetratricopeptide (TPR) repeat protein